MTDIIVKISLTIFINTLTAVNILLLTQLLFGVPLCKKKHHYLIIAGVFALLNLVGILLFRESINIQTILIYVCIIVPILILAKGRRIRAVFSTIPAILVYTQWSEIMRMMDKLVHLDKYYIMSDGIELTPLYSMADFFLVILLFVSLHFCYKKDLKIQLTFVEALIVSLFSIFSPILYQCFVFLEEAFNNVTFSTAWVLFLLILNVAVFYGVIHRSVARHYKMLAENYKDQFSAEYAYFKNYKHQQKATANLRHDWNNHMLLLQGMLNNGDYEKAKKYFHDLTSQNKVLNKNILTGNEAVDIIFNAKSEVMENENIRFDCDGDLEPLKFMEDVDICILFSNLIDNAIEANRKCNSERFLTVKATHKSNLFLVTVSNRMNGEIQLSENGIKTTKENECEHGIGTQNAFATIKKYHGEYDIVAEKDIFTIKMWFSM